VSRRFIRASARKLQELSERRLEGYDLVAILLDGKTFAEDEMVVAVGVTITGENVLLGLVQTATENRKICATFLRDLIDRGPQFDLGLLAVTDGAMGLHAAVREVLGRPGSCSAANGTSDKTSSSICRSGLGRRFGESCRPPMRSRRTRKRNGRSARSGLSSCGSTPRPRAAWTRVSQRTETAVARDRAVGSRTAAPPDQELPRASVAQRSVATTAGNKEVGGVNPERSLPNFNYEWA
jgi:hypothetical protein